MPARRESKPGPRGGWTNGACLAMLPRRVQPIGTLVILFLPGLGKQEQTQPLAFWFHLQHRDLDLDAWFQDQARVKPLVQTHLADMDETFQALLQSCKSAKA